MAMRREKVVLEIEDRFTTGMIRAAGATKLLEQRLKELDGTSVRSSRGLGGLDRPLGDLDRSARKTYSSINQLTGRIRLMMDTAAALGPALVPIGAAGTTAIVGLAAQFGALAGGIGVSVAAFSGMGDALDALNKAQLEPTEDNLAAMRLEMEKLGPAGAQFVQYLDSVTPQLREIQMVAREGLLPGVQEGIESLLRMSPQVKAIVSDLALTMGELARSSGEALSGDAFAGFFDYVDRQAGPLLLEFGQTIGNVTEGIANLLVGFEPLTSQFSGGLLEMTESFARWSRGLSENADFQAFVDYLRQSGPQVVDFLGSMVDAVASLVQAAAPLGSAVLPALTALADAFAAIASSPIGTPLLTAAAAFATFNRAAKIAQSTTSMLTTSLDRMGYSGDRVAGSMSKVGRAASVAGQALAAFAIVDSLQTQFKGLDTGLSGVTNQLLTLANSGAGAKLGGEFDNLAASFERLTDPNKAQALQDWLNDAGAGLLFGSDSRVDEAVAQIEAIDSALANIAATGSAGQAREAFASLATSMGLSGAEMQKLLEMLPQYRDALAASEVSARLAADGTDKFADSARDSADAAKTEAAAIERGNQVMRQRRQAALAAFDAETQYRQALVAAREAAKANSAGIRGNSEAALNNRQALSGLAAAWANQSQAVRTNSARQREARQAFIEAAVGMGVGEEAAKRLANRMLDIPKKVESRAYVETAEGQQAIANLRSALDGIDGKTATTYIRTFNETLNIVRSVQGMFGLAAGSYVGDTCTALPTYLTEETTQ
jgi:hypothetical protein